MKTIKTVTLISCLVLVSLIHPVKLHCQDLTLNPDLDKRVKIFLEEQSVRWNDLNVPESDGKLLHDLVLKGRYKKSEK